MPPPGEFRWIHVKDTEKSKEAAERRLFAAQPKVNPEIQVATAVVEAERTAKRTTRPMSAAERAAQRELEAAFGDDEANVATTTSEPNRNDSQSRNDSSVVESEQGVPADNTTTESFDEPIGTGVRNQLRTPKPSEVSLRQQTEIRPLDPAVIMLLVPQAREIMASHKRVSARRVLRRDAPRPMTHGNKLAVHRVA